VTWGDVDDDAIDEYVASGQWRGKAGGYNLEERLEAGWPIECEGDPTTVMGLPMRRLAAMSCPDNRASLS
jgi:septum formation protein